ncbi:MAG: sulfite exporter TauE/SafE family protein [Candidatus Omnitrophica bacterium]|nr:sulfite exporter TauE/SafE family protein [Candidatus Omnitrophota bacterium]
MLENLSEYIQSAPLLALIIIYIGGVLTSFTPCVFPIIPITIGVLGTRNASSKIHALLISLVYVFGMAVVYASLGMIAAQTGKLFGSVSVHPVTNIIVGNVCIIFALSMLDVITIPLPSFLTSRRIASGNTKSIISVFIMGALSGTVIAPCTAPILGTVLAFVSSTQSVLYGALLLFVFAFGLGTLLIIIGTFSGILISLQKGGKWMVLIKKILGVCMIFIAEYFFVRAGMMWY